MAEALCGPSNPIQNLQKHTSVDRTLQQDRIVSRHSPAQGFRTSSPFAGTLDAEFHAFQAPKSLNAHQFPLQPLQAFNQPQFPAQVQHVSPFAAQHPASSWASDFQQLNLSSPRPAISSFQSRGEEFQDTVGNGWHTEFMEQADHQSRRAFSHSNQVSGSGWQSQFQSQSYMNGMMNYEFPMLQQQQPQQAPPEHLDFDEAAFERAFDAAHSAAQQSALQSKGKERADDAVQPTFDMSFACTDPGDIMGEYDFDQNASTLGLDRQDADAVAQFSELRLAREDFGVHSPAPVEDVRRIGSDTIPAQKNLSPEAESDELARTAGQLLDTLKHEPNSKFQQSSFLGLMRQLRDREVRIEGDKMVSVSMT